MPKWPLMLLCVVGCSSQPQDAPPPPISLDASDAQVHDAGSNLDAPNAPDQDAATCSRSLDPEEELFSKTFIPKTSESDFPSPTAPIQPNHVAQTTEVSVHCIAAAAAERRARQCAAFDPTYRAKFVPAVKAAVQWLRDAGYLWHNWGGPGYGFPWSGDPSDAGTPGFDAFNDGTLNAVTTVYAYETGYAVWCLSEAADVLGDSSLRSLASTVLSNYSTHAYTTTAVDCPGCGYFWYSMDSNDLNRYVKNTNIEMGLASLVFNRYGADSAAKTRGTAAAASQNHELAVRQNHEYLGYLDPQYVPGETYIDGHTTMEIQMLYQAGQLLHNSTYEQTALDFMSFVKTTTAYQQHPTYIVDAQCALARWNPAMLVPCAGYAQSYPGRVDLSIFPLVLDYSK